MQLYNQEKTNSHIVIASSSSPTLSGKYTLNKQWSITSAVSGPVRWKNTHTLSCVFVLG